LQLLVERLAWNIVKYDYDELTCPVVTRRVFFRLFCIFNRLCDAPSNMPMRLSFKAAAFVAREIGFSSRMFDDMPAPDFNQLLKKICAQRQILDTRAIKKLYDELVRDVLKEGRVRYRVLDGKGAGILGGGTAGGDKVIRTATVTSRQLIIYDDDPSDVHANLEQPHSAEPTGRVLFRLPLMDTETRVLRGLLNKNKMYLQLSSKSRGGARILELIFDKTSQDFDLYSWSQALQEAAYATQINSNRLTKVQHRLSLSSATPNVLNLAPDGIGTRRTSAPDIEKLDEKRSPPETLALPGSSALPTSTTTKSAASTPTFKPSVIDRRKRYLSSMGRSTSETHLRVHCSGEDAPGLVSRVDVVVVDRPQEEEEDKRCDEKMRSSALSEHRVSLLVRRSTSSESGCSSMEPGDADIVTDRVEKEKKKTWQASASAASTTSARAC